MVEKWKYILYGQGMKAMAVHSSLNYQEFCDFIRENSRKLHKDGSDVVFQWGVQEFVNPKVFMRDSFVDYLPALIGLK